MTGDAIAAIATAPGRAGIGVVRVSGPSLAALAERLCARKLAARRAEYVSFHREDGEAIDTGLALWFPAPQSYTGEDVLELQAHGSPVVLRLLLARCLELGCWLAEPGEFTRRAYVNDKLDLAQAEAVADLIAANTDAAARSALRSLSGAFSGEIHALTESLVELRMLAEANIDFPEEGVDFLAEADATGRLAELQAALAAIQTRARAGAILRRGLQVVLAGAPNVGKSSLLNRLAGRELAIVTAVPGTTRDTVRETLDVDGIPVNMVDTAGLRDTRDEVESLGIARSWQEIAQADAVLLMADARDGVTDAERAIIARLPANVRRILVFNKIDLAGISARREARTGNPAAVALYLSAKSGAGIDLLREELKAVAGWEDATEDVFMARERHLDALNRAGAALAAAAMHRTSPELFAEELRAAQAALVGITGEFTADDLLGEIFSRFCIGK